MEYLTEAETSFAAHNSFVHVVESSFKSFLSLMKFILTLNFPLTFPKSPYILYLLNANSSPQLFITSYCFFSFLFTFVSIHLFMPLIFRPTYYFTIISLTIPMPSLLFRYLYFLSSLFIFFHKVTPTSRGNDQLACWRPRLPPSPLLWPNTFAWSFCLFPRAAAVGCGVWGSIDGRSFDSNYQPPGRCYGDQRCQNDFRWMSCGWYCAAAFTFSCYSIL